jgi:tetratricopeptide (TPR) repeat protein
VRLQKENTGYVQPTFQKTNGQRRHKSNCRGIQTDSHTGRGHTYNFNGHLVLQTKFKSRASGATFFFIGITMNLPPKSKSCLDNSYRAFRAGDSNLAIKSLNITFNHVSNTDWSATDILNILDCLTWLYFYENRLDKVSATLQRAIAYNKKSKLLSEVGLAYLHYNLAECYARQSKLDKCKANFSLAINLLETTLGAEHKTFRLIKRRYLEVCVVNQVEIHQEKDTFEVPITESHNNQKNISPPAKRIDYCLI